MALNMTPEGAGGAAGSTKEPQGLVDEACAPVEIRRGILEIWDVVLRAEDQHVSLWVRHTMVTQASGSTRTGGWVTVFGPDGRWHSADFSPNEDGRPSVAGATPSASANKYFDDGAVRLSSLDASGVTSGAVWNLDFRSCGAPLWVTPRHLWGGPAVTFGEVVTPLDRVEGEVRLEGTRFELSEMRGVLSHRRCSRHPRRWSRAYFDLPGGDCAAVSVVEPARTFLRRPGAVVFLKLRLDGREVPATGLLPGLHFARRSRAWKVFGSFGRRRIDVRVAVPETAYRTARDFDSTAYAIASEVAADAPGELRLLSHREGPLWVVEKAWRTGGGVIVDVSETRTVMPERVSSTTAALVCL